MPGETSLTNNRIAVQNASRARRHAAREIEIIRHLLANPELTTLEIAALCGFGALPDGGRDNVRRQMDQLEGEGYLEVEERLQSETRRVGYYWIRRDIGVIRDLAARREYQKYADAFRESGWVRDMILDQGIDFDLGDCREDAREMLRVSRRFFDYCLHNPVRDDDILDWTARIEFPVPSALWFSERFDVEEAHQPRPHLIYDLFTFCMFADQIETPLDLESYVFLTTMARKAACYRQTARGYRTSVAVIDAILAVRDACDENEGAFPEALAENLDTYEEFRRVFLRTKQPLPELREELDETYNAIAADLGLATVRGECEIAFEDFRIDAPDGVVITYKDILAIVEREYDAVFDEIERENAAAADQKEKP